MSNRRVHASGWGEEVVRYDRQGKWYIELVPPSPDAPLRKAIPIREAVQRAIELRDQGGTIHLGVPGGNRFDSMIKEAT